MPDWTAPFKIPQFTDDEWRKQKAKHVAEKGYTITMPGLSDVFHFGAPEPMTKSEEYLWKKKEWGAFSRERLHELQRMKKKKRERYEAMLASPTPDFHRNAGSILTAIDNAQDAISTLACIGRIAVRFAPRLLGRFFLGPIGWLLTASDILNLMMTIGQLAIYPKPSKRLKDLCTKEHPFSKKAKALRAKKMLRGMPTKGDIIQALQTTDGIFGVGISLGPIVGFVQDMIAGGIRAIAGQKVEFKSPWEETPTYTPPPPEETKIKYINRVPDLPEYQHAAMKTLKSSSYALAHEHGTDEMMIMELLLANYYAHQVLLTTTAEWNPLEMVEGIEKTQVQIPYPENILTLEVIQESNGPDPRNAIWPGVGRPWADIEVVSDITHPVATENLRNFVGRNKNNWLGYAGGVLACETSTYALANLEGEADVKYDYTATSKIAGNLLDAGYYPDPDQPREKLNTFVKFLDDAEKYDLPTSQTAILSFCTNNGIQLLEISGPP